MSGESESRMQRELEVIREISRAFLTAWQPLEVYRLALARVLPLVRASFASIFLRDEDDSDLLRLICAHNWPQSSARYLGQLRIRVGRGPTGQAVAESRPIEVEDVFDDPALREWWEPARELDFSSLISLPLPIAGRTAGALSFYFSRPHTFTDEERDLLNLTAQQLAATAERAHRIEALERERERLAAEIERLEERVRDADETRRLKDEFLANMSHELRTPLTSILGYAFLVRSGHAGDINDEQDAALAKIESAGTALDHLIADILELSQLKLGRTAVDIVPAEALSLCRQAIQAAGPAPEGVSIELHTPDGTLPLLTDVAKVTKILQNLISNAFKFTTRGRVDVTVRQHRGTVAARIVPHANGAGRREHVSVEWVIKDSGIGIDPDEMEAIFDEFRQVDGSSTRLYGGTGLGLALSLRLTRLLGGEILVDSEPGEGSTFTLRLPTRYTAADARPARPDRDYEPREHAAPPHARPHDATTAPAPAPDTEAGAEPDALAGAEPEATAEPDPDATPDPDPDPDGGAGRDTAS